LLADLASDLILVATRGGGADASKLRMLRERVGQLKTGIELAVTATLSKHALPETPPADEAGTASGE
jgi:hypothetical protein